MPVVLWLKVAEGQILEFPLHLPDAETIGEWREYGTGLGGQTPLSRRRQVPRGTHPCELNADARHDKAWVGDDGKQHLAQHFSLRLLQPALRIPMGGIGEFAESSETFDRAQRRLVHLLGERG